MAGQLAHELGEDEADGDGAEALPAGVVRLIVADVERAMRRVPTRVRVPRTRKPRLIGLRAFVLHLLRLDRVDAGDRGDDTDGSGGEREHEAEGQGSCRPS